MQLSWRERIEEKGELARYCGYIDREMYSEQIKSLHRSFGRNEVKMIKFEELKDNTERKCKEISKFMGIEAKNLKT